jgi:hypothetical protein
LAIGDGDIRDFSPHGFDRSEERQDYVLYWLEGMREPRMAHRPLATP